MPVLNVTQNGKTRQITFEGEKLLSDLLFGTDMRIDLPCGGRGTCKKCTVFVDGKEELACRYTVCDSANVVVPYGGEIVSVSGAKESGKVTENLCFCLDIVQSKLQLVQQIQCLNICPSFRHKRCRCMQIQHVRIG